MMANENETVRALLRSTRISAPSNPPKKDMPEYFRGDASGNVQQGVANSLHSDCILSPSCNFVIKFPDVVPVDLGPHAVIQCQRPCKMDLHTVTHTETVGRLLESSDFLVAEYDWPLVA